MKQTPQENEIRCRNGSYVVFDVETPNHRNDRISAIGITVVRNGAIAGDFYSLVDPETDFDYFNTRLTGISEKLVRGHSWEKVGADRAPHGRGRAGGPQRRV